MWVNHAWKTSVLIVFVGLALLMRQVRVEATPLYPLSDRWLADADGDDLGDSAEGENNSKIIVGDIVANKETRGGLLFDLTGEDVAGAGQITLSVTVAYIPSGSPFDIRLVHVAQAHYTTPEGEVTEPILDPDTGLPTGGIMVSRHAYQAVGATVVGSLSGHDPDNDGIVLAADVTGPTIDNLTVPGDTLVFDVTSFVKADALDTQSFSLFRLEVADPGVASNGDGLPDNFQFWSGHGGISYAAPGAYALPQLNFGPALLLAGDMDGDGFVGLGDLDIVLGHWNQTVTAGDLLLGDPSGDGYVGLDDLDVVLGNWNAGTPPAGNPVPEPASLGLLGLGGLAWLLRRR